MVWKAQVTRRKHKKGRASGGMSLGIRKDFAVQREKEGREVKGIITGKIKVGKGSWRVEFTLRGTWKGNWKSWLIGWKKVGTG